MSQKCYILKQTNKARTHGGNVSWSFGNDTFMYSGKNAEYFFELLQMSSFWVNQHFFFSQTHSPEFVRVLRGNRNQYIHPTASEPILEDIYIYIYCFCFPLYIYLIYNTYCKKVAHVITEAEKSRDPQLASWSPRRGGTVVTVCVSRWVTRRVCAPVQILALSGSRMKEPAFQFTPEVRKRPRPQLNSQAGPDPSFLAFLFSPSLQMVG